MSADSGTAVFLQRVPIVLGLVVLGLFLWHLAYALLRGFAECWAVGVPLAPARLCVLGGTNKPGTFRRSPPRPP